MPMFATFGYCNVCPDFESILDSLLCEGPSLTHVLHTHDMDGGAVAEGQRDTSDKWGIGMRLFRGCPSAKCS